MKTIIVDTNAWMSMIEFKMDLFTALDQICDFSYKVAVLEGTLQELKKIQENQKGKEKLTAKLVLDIIKKKNIETIPSIGFVDDVLVELSKDGYLVLTQDIELRKRLAKPHLVIRQKKYVMMVK